MATNYCTLEETATQLNLPITTIQEWSDEFVEFLSMGASAISGEDNRRYTELDLAKLLTVREYTTNGLTFDEIREKLQEQTDHLASSSLVSSGDAAMANAMADYLSEMLDNIRQGQMSVLNSQAANRELMGVVIQDNFNLKEENKRLRERMLNLEHQMEELRQEEMVRREAIRRELDAKLMRIQSPVNQLPAPTPPVDSAQNQLGCWSKFFKWGNNSPEGVVENTAYTPPQPPFVPGPPRPFPKPPGPPE